MDCLGFRELSNLIKYYTTIVNGTILKAEYTIMENHTLLKDINNFLYFTQPNFSEDTPNQILHMLGTLILWSKTFYTTIGQYPTLYDFLAIAPKDISLGILPNVSNQMSETEYFLTYTTTSTFVLRGDVTSHA